MNNLGNIAKEQQQFYEAKEYYQQAQEFAESAYNSKFLAAGYPQSSTNSF
ncbi:tetratricopeptide repeat protein [Candidatus Uabimicrobium amorphum]